VVSAPQVAEAAVSLMPWAQNARLNRLAFINYIDYFDQAQRLFFLHLSAILLILHLRQKEWISTALMHTTTEKRLIRALANAATSAGTFIDKERKLSFLVDPFAALVVFFRSIGSQLVPTCTGRSKPKHAAANGQCRCCCRFSHLC
jgi:hypothetical protein